MEVIKNINQTTDKGADVSKKYIATSYKYAKLKLFHLLAVSISTVVKLFCIGGIIFLGMIFLSIALANYLGQYFNNIALGYMSVGISFLVISFLIFLSRKFIEKKIIQNMSKIFFDTKKQ